jgi:hypothetical protein
MIVSNVVRFVNYALGTAEGEIFFSRVTDGRWLREELGVQPEVLDESKAMVEFGHLSQCGYQTKDLTVQERIASSKACLEAEERELASLNAALSSQDDIVPF